MAWRACDALAFWRLLLLLYCLGIFQAAGSHVASGIFMRFRCAPLHVLVILPSSAFLPSLVCRVFVGLFTCFLQGFSQMKGLGQKRPPGFMEQYNSIVP